MSTPTTVNLHERRLECLYKVSSIIATDQDQQHILALILKELHQDAGLPHGVITLLSPDHEALIVEAVEGRPQGQTNSIRYRKGEGITGRVLQTGQSIVIPRIADEPEFQSRIILRQQEHELDAAFICVPITDDNQVIGTLSVDTPPLPDDELQSLRRFLNIVASMIANDVRVRRVSRIENATLSEENLRLRQELEQLVRPENIIGNSRAMREIYARIQQVANSDTTVLIRGESGAGKELVASALHYNSERSKAPFVRVNCSALSEGLLESELFGHEKGAFTGALHQRIGRIEEAEGGTLFLDEIGEFSSAIQVKLLRVLQEREYERVGSNETRRANVRIICATNRDLEQAIEDDVFRQDLYYRINVFPVILPPLRERKDDIMLLANHFVEKYNSRMNKKVKRISTPAINMLFAYHWPGNVRELENCIEHAMLLAQDEVIHGRNLPPTLQTPDENNDPEIGNLKARIRMLEKDMITDALKVNNGNVTAAARDLGITSRMVRYKLEILKIDHKKLGGN